MSETLPAQRLASATATCPAGSRIVGGGMPIPSRAGNVIATYPAGDRARAVSAAVNPLAQTLTAYAICAAT